LAPAAALACPSAEAEVPTVASGQACELTNYLLRPKAAGQADGLELVSSLARAEADQEAAGQPGTEEKARDGVTRPAKPRATFDADAFVLAVAGEPPKIGDEAMTTAEFFTSLKAGLRP
jgi:hypothetical protein